MDAEIDDEISDSDESDVWENPNIKSREKLPIEDVRGPAVLIPHKGQSYNPVYKDHQELMEKIVDEETSKAKRDIHHQHWNMKPIEVQEEKEKKPKSLKGRIHFEMVQKRKAEKKLNRDFANLKKIKREVDHEHHENERKSEETKLRKAEEKKLIKEGKLIKTKNLGTGKFVYKGTDFKLNEELKPTLR